ncbi:MAG: hypothetical protein AB7U79_04375 [Candidatus Izemoplasmatales bacterium]
MKKKIKWIILSFFIIVLAGLGYVYFNYLFISNFTSNQIKQLELLELPKSEVYKVTSTAKGDNQSKLARLGDTVFTYYLDNSGCVDASARGNDKTMRLLLISSNGEIVEFDSIDVWMHGNVLVDETREIIYYTTYEEVLVGQEYFGQVKIYTYDFHQGDPVRISETMLKDDQSYPFEANPRVGADIDQDGNIAVAYSNYQGMMFVHVYDAVNNTWTEHKIEYYLDTYLYDCNLYPYVRLDGTNHIRLIANRDTSVGPDGNYTEDLARDYTRYFSYENGVWTNWVFSDLRDETEKNGESSTSVPMDLFLDSNDTSHIIMKEDNQLVYYLIDREGNTTYHELPDLKLDVAVQFIRILEVNQRMFFVVSGQGITGFSRVGYLAIYDYETEELLYQSNQACYTPYLYIIEKPTSSTIDIMVISRDKDYDEHSSTYYFQLQLTE